MNIFCNLSESGSIEELSPIPSDKTSIIIDESYFSLKNPVFIDNNWKEDTIGVTNASPVSELCVSKFKVALIKYIKSMCNKEILSKYSYIDQSLILFNYLNNESDDNLLDSYNYILNTRKKYNDIEDLINSALNLEELFSIEI